MFVALWLLHVPAALLLALLAGVCDFVPVLGFAVSSVPAVLLALTVSAGTAIAVAAVYIGYHLAENYFIGPRVYGGQLRLSNLAVLLAFAVGAELGGVVGALLALPVAAMTRWSRRFGWASISAGTPSKRTSGSTAKAAE